MAVRTVFRWSAGILLVAAWAVSVQGQQLYVGSGTVVHSRIYGPYAQPVYPHPGPGLHVTSPFGALPVYVPAFGPYLYGPVLAPYAYVSWPHPYPRPVYSAPVTPGQGYQPQGPAPRFGDPIVPAIAPPRRTTEQSARPNSPAAPTPAPPPPSVPADPRVPAPQSQPADPPAPQVFPVH